MCVSVIRVYNIYILYFQETWDPFKHLFVYGIVANKFFWAVLKHSVYEIDLTRVSGGILALYILRYNIYDILFVIACLEETDNCWVLHTLVYRLLLLSVLCCEIKDVYFRDRTCQDKCMIGVCLSLFLLWNSMNDKMAKTKLLYMK